MKMELSITLTRANSKMSAWLLLASRPVAQVRSSADTFVAPMLKLKSHKVLQTYQHFIQAKKKKKSTTDAVNDDT